MPFLAPFIAPMLISFAISIAISVLTMILFPKPGPQRRQQQNLPPPPNGTFNERQSIPPRRAGFGRCRTGGDYMTLEEKAGIAYHQLAHMSHRVKGTVQHWLHDELVTLNDKGFVTAPAHFAQKVRIETRNGDNRELAWHSLRDALPSIWTDDHRGDGISQIRMSVWSVDAQSFGNVFPQGMPEHTSLDDLAFLYDPRDPAMDPDDEDTWQYSRNIALGLLFFVTHPSGYKRTLDDLVMEDWIEAANNCDEIVLNRDGVEENRYWGGLTWKHQSSSEDPVSIGRKIAEAGDLVLYTNGEGKIGVHAGKMKFPTVRLTLDEITEFKYNSNQAETDTVLAVRGRFIDPRNAWMPSDAAVYGDPYADSTQRTGTIENEAVQSHNHMQRLQKLKFIRANAPKVSIRIAYDDPQADVLFSRFVRVHVPEYGMNEAIVEIVNGAKLDLSPNNFSIQFDGIIVPENLYDFNAATEEGLPGGIVGTVEATGVPMPTGFAIANKSESLASGATFAYVEATWDHFDDTFVHELQYQINDESQAPRSVSSNPGEDKARTPSLEAGIIYKFRLRAWSAGSPGPWTDYLTNEDEDLTPPKDPYSLRVEVNGIDPATADISWNNPDDDTLDNTVVYISGGGFDVATVAHTDRSGPRTAVTWTTSPNWPPVGTDAINIWVKAFNSNGVGSNLIGPVTI